MTFNDNDGTLSLTRPKGSNSNFSEFFGAPILGLNFLLDRNTFTFTEEAYKKGILNLVNREEIPRHVLDRIANNVVECDADSLNDKCTTYSELDVATLKYNGAYVEPYTDEPNNPPVVRVVIPNDTFVFDSKNNKGSFEFRVGQLCKSMAELHTQQKEGLAEAINALLGDNLQTALSAENLGIETDGFMQAIKAKYYGKGVPDKLEEFLKDLAKNMEGNCPLEIQENSSGKNRVYLIPGGTTIGLPPDSKAAQDYMEAFVAYAAVQAQRASKSM